MQTPVSSKKRLKAVLSLIDESRVDAAASANGIDPEHLQELVEDFKVAGSVALESTLEPNLRKLAIGVGIGVVLLWIALPWLFKFTGLGEDSYSAPNTLFSGLAMAGVILAILMQREELRHQRQELKLQRIELQETRDEHRQSRIAQEQSSEALVERLSLERDLAKKRQTLSLYDEFHSKDIHESRRYLDPYIQSWQQGASSRVKLSDLELPGANPELSLHSFRIYHFFEKWAVLSKCHEIDEALMARFLGSYYRSWWSSFFVEIEKLEDNDDMIETLAMIREIKV